MHVSAGNGTERPKLHSAFEKHLHPHNSSAYSPSALKNPSAFAFSFFSERLICPLQVHFAEKQRSQTQQ
jgi:hypothetical protein